MSLNNLVFEYLWISSFCMRVVSRLYKSRELNSVFWWNRLTILELFFDCVIMCAYIHIFCVLVSRIVYMFLECLFLLCSHLIVIYFLLFFSLSLSFCWIFAPFLVCKPRHLIQLSFWFHRAKGLIWFAVFFGINESA